MARRIFYPLLIAFLLLAYTAQPVSAHTGDEHGLNLWGQWTFEPLVMLGLAAAALIYLRGWNTLMRRGVQARPPLWKRWAFAGGLLTVFLSLASPLDALAGELFSVHLVQHSLLMLVAPPLLLLGLPMPTLLLGLPRRVQTGMGRAYASMPLLRYAAHAASRPLVAWLLMAGVLWGWHAPPLYSAAVQNDLIHAIQHGSFMAAAMLFWWVVLRVYGRNPEQGGMGVMYLFTTALHSGLLGALITFSRTPWYPVYAETPQAFGLTALADQQLAGTIMWIPAGLVFLAAGLGMMKLWIESISSEEGTAQPKEVK